MDISKSDIIIPETGEVKNVCHFKMPTGQFDKAWFGGILAQCNISSMQSLSVLCWMVSNRDYSSNKVSKTQEAIHHGSGVSLKVVNKSIKEFCKAGLMTRVQNGTYMINPAIIVSGDSQKQAYLLLEFNKEVAKNAQKHTKR